MTRKPKLPQKESLTEVSGRDSFQTPNYAVDLLAPYLRDIEPMSSFASFNIWECAAGMGKIVRRLSEHNFDVCGSDLDGREYPKHNFLTQANGQSFDCIVTNPPFSLKRKFFERCVKYDKPFALLIPADYTGWLIEAVDKYGCEKIIPTRRIDYVTPDILNRIHEGELFELARVEEALPKNVTLAKYKEMFPGAWGKWENKYPDLHLYNSIYTAPSTLLRKYSSSMFHSMWLTRYFDLGQTETFVELSNEEKNNI